MIVNITEETGRVAVGKLNYGTVVSGVSTHPKSVYIKINKNDPGSGITLRVPAKHSLLMNVSTGGLRTVPGDTEVDIYDGEMRVSKQKDIGIYLKDRYALDHATRLCRP